MNIVSARFEKISVQNEVFWEGDFALKFIQWRFCCLSTLPPTTTTSLILPTQPVGLCSWGPSACSHDEHHPGVPCPDRFSVGCSIFLFLSFANGCACKRGKKLDAGFLVFLLGFWHTAAWARREQNFSARLFSPCRSSLPSGESFLLFIFACLATFSPSAIKIFSHLDLSFFSVLLPNRVRWMRGGPRPFPRPSPFSA